MADSWFRKLLGSADHSGRRHKSFGVAEPTPASPPSRLNRYQAVSVIACNKACNAVAGVQGVRFLARQAPRLPLMDCDRPDLCRCRFEKYQDRRSAVQRSPYSNSTMVSFGGAERRGGRGRRGTDR